MLGQRTSLTSTVPAQGLSGALTKYYYDNLYQLTKADYPAGTPWNGEVHSWTYDAIGNRLTNTVNSTTQNYTYQKVGSNPLNWQRLLSDGVNSYGYHPDGTTKSKTAPEGTYWFTLDSGNRMSGITGPVTASYGYDYQGRRRAKTVGGVTTKYLYDGLNLIGELGASPADYLFGPGIDEPLAMNRGGQVSYYAPDALGSVNALTNSSGAVQNTYLYDAWGQTKAQTGSLTNPFTYTSREAGEAGALFYRARYLNPGVGRFLSEDPLTNASPDFGDRDRYNYVLNMPIIGRDPLGLFKIDGSCDCLDFQRAGESQSRGRTLRQEVSRACNQLVPKITDPKIRQCVERSCDKGTVECENDCRTEPRRAFAYSRGSPYLWRGAPWKNRTMHLCINTSFDADRPVGFRGEMAVHEWAHGCGWAHGDGRGVPRDPGPRPVF